MTTRRTALALLLAAPGTALACRNGALGTARMLPVPSAGGPQFGLKSYDATLPLADGEVVLTFDDGPVPGLTDRVLTTLAHECVHATFFLIGRNAAASPHLVRRMVAEGHTVANHTMTHPWTLRNLGHDAAWENILAGERMLASIVGAAVAPFFRFPGFADTPRLLDALSQANRAVLGADFWASDWNSMAPAEQLQLVMSRLRRARKGIVLFHDTRPQTVAMLPMFLDTLKREGFRIAHMVG
ncbi:CDA1 Predicted xylanase/chitin deacetylase [Rhabdaerophilaceae bacterium]